MSNKKWKSSLADKGMLGLLCLAVIGVGAVFLALRTQNINVQGNTGGNTGGNVVNVPSGEDKKPVGNNQLPPTVLTSPDKSDNSTSTPHAGLINVKATGETWTLEYPVYKKVDRNCTVINGASGVVLKQTGEALGYEGVLNGYSVYNQNKVRSRHTIQGTVSASGAVTLSLESNEFFVTMKSEKTPTITRDETVITGKASALNCPETTFKLRKTN